MKIYFSHFTSQGWFICCCSNETLSWLNCCLVPELAGVAWWEEKRIESQHILTVWWTAQTEVKKEEQPNPTWWGNVCSEIWSLLEKPGFPQLLPSCTQSRTASWGLNRRRPRSGIGTHSPRWEILQRPGASQRDTYNDAYFPEDCPGLNK